MYVHSRLHLPTLGLQLHSTLSLMTARKRSSWFSGGGGGVVCMRDTFILDDIWAQDKIYILVCALLD
jgi:hypothetical protein